MKKQCLAVHCETGRSRGDIIGVCLRFMAARIRSGRMHGQVHERHQLSEVASAAIRLFIDVAGMAGE